jgi:hypothetical protein
MSLDRAIEQTQNGEVDLAAELTRIGTLHAAESDIRHITEMLSRRCSSQLDLLASHARRYGVAERTTDGPPPQRHEAAKNDLLDDLRDLYLAAHRAELAWVVLEQGAHSARDAGLLTAARQGRDEAERRWRWVRTKIKEAAPQALIAD